MVCELKITSGSKINCVKISWWSDIALKSYYRKTVLSGHEIHSSLLCCTDIAKENFAYLFLVLNVVEIVSNL